MKLEERLCPWLVGPLSELERAAASERLGHGWIVAGPEGLGKLNLVLVFASRLLRGRLGSSPPPPFGPDAALAAMSERREFQDHHADLHLLFPEEEKRTIAVEQVRAITEALQLKSFHGGAKVVVIEPAEAMTAAAANALLKSLEEPRPGTFLLLISHRPGRLPSTIRSRCQTLVVRRPAQNALEQWLATDRGSGDGVANYLTSATPLSAAEQTTDDYINNINDIYNNLNSICRNQADPQSVAERWLKQDLRPVLEQVVERIAIELRRRFGAQVRNPVTDPLGPLADNPWDSLPSELLLEQLSKAEALRDQLGSGINAELGLKVLLIGFMPAEAVHRPA